MWLLLITYLLPVITLIIMFWILLTGDIRRTTDVKFFQLFLVNLIAWLALLWSADMYNDSTHSLYLLRLALFAGSFAPLAFYLFSQAFVSNFSKLITGLFMLLASSFGVLSLTGFMISGVETGNIGVKVTQYTSLYFLQTIYTILAFGVSFLWLKLSANKKGDFHAASQVRYITLGAIFGLAIGIIGGTIHTSGTNLLSPMAVTVFAAGAFFAIVRHGLFEIRLVVARSIAYVLSLGIITVAFSFLVFGFSSVILESSYPKVLQDVFYVLVTLALVLTYPPLKRFFDKLTNRLFYRDAYDPQVLLDELSSVLVAHVELQELLKQSSSVISKHLKLEDCSYALRYDDKDSLRVFGNHRETESIDIAGIQKSLRNSGRKVIDATDLRDVSGSALEALRSSSVMVASKLMTHSGLIGYLLLGDKKSGNVFTSQDKKIIEIVSDELAIAIQNALRFEEISRFNVTLRQRVEEATKELRTANRRLKALDRAKDEFISMASHQLRTPLTSVKGYLSMALEGDAGKLKTEQQEIMQHAYDSAQRMVYLISDLLNVSRLQTGKFVIENKPTHLADVVEEEMSQLKEQAAVREITMSYDKPEHFPELNLDETKIRQVMMNFMDNALYYTPKGGTVTIALSATDEAVTFTVTDTGVGVPKSVQHHLFTKFYRADNARQMRPDGTGLGLFMAKKVVVAQGGAIIFRSTEGKGSTFGFSFPRKELETTAAKPALA